MRYQAKPRVQTSALTRGVLSGVALMLAGVLAAEEQPAAGSDERDLTPGTEATTSMRAERFVKIDLNADGYITRDEVDEDANVLQSQYDQLDSNDDGRLDQAEFATFEDVEADSSRKSGPKANGP